MPNTLVNNQLTLGWDVGGAHLKAALVDASGIALQVVQVACPLWKGIDKLATAIHTVLDKLDQYPQQHAVTMTGELADIFPDRRTGVIQIADVLSEQLVGRIGFYAGQQDYVALADVVIHADAIASANWQASVQFIGKFIPDTLFVDIGSTTTDIVPIAEGAPAPRGKNDAERMRFEELVYTGVVRTPLMSLASRIPFQGEWYSLAAEHFATTADIYRLTGDLQESSDMSDTADGGGRSLLDSARRLARMIGQDVEDEELSHWIQLAYAFQHAQLNTLKSALLRHASLRPETTKTIVGAGAGNFLVERLASQLDAEYVDVKSLVKAGDEETRAWAAICLPAYAVAWLALQA